MLVSMRVASRVVLAIVLIASGAAAQDVPADARVVRAREAYDRGAAAYDAHDYAKAAVELARADELAPNPTTLALALEASIRGRDAPRVMELVERVEKRIPEGTPLFARAREARTLFASEADAQRASPPASPPAPVNVPVPVPVPDSSSSSLHSTPPHDPSPGLRPTWFWVAGAATLVLGGVTAASAVDTKNKHDTYAANRSPDARDSGQSAQTRTNVFFVATAVAAVSTATLGIFFVGWSNGPAVTASARF
jgi:hypothetical protein